MARARSAVRESESDGRAFWARARVAARLAPAAARWVPELTKKAVQLGGNCGQPGGQALRPGAAPRRAPHDRRRGGAVFTGRPGLPGSRDARFAHHANRALREPDRRRRVVQRSRAADRAWMADARRRALRANGAGPIGGGPMGAGPIGPGAVPGRSIVVNGQRWCRC
jgi:hypothetical protein